MKSQSKLCEAPENSEPPPVYQLRVSPPGSKRLRSLSFLIPLDATPWAKSEVIRRLRCCHRFTNLLHDGYSRAAAARQLHIPYVTLWRWLQRPLPEKHKCGRKSRLSVFDPPPEMLLKIERLQVVGLSNKAAWLAAAELPECPGKLKNFLRLAKSLPPSFLSATRLHLPTRRGKKWNR